MQNSSESERDFNYFFRQDILKLLNNFYQLKSFRFEQFLTIWNEMKFYQLFWTPRFFPFDYRYYMKDLLKIGSEYLYDEELYPEVRTGALYVIYAIYFNQSNRPRTKVPVSTEQWIQILKFVDFLNQAEHVDAEYVFRHLLHSDAFEFCSFFEIKNRSIMTYKIGSRNLRATGDESLVEHEFSMADFKDFVLNDELNEQMGTIHEAYLQCKEDLVKLNSSSFTNSYINQNFGEIIGEDLISQLEESGNDDGRKKETVYEKIKRKLAENMEHDDVPKTSKAKTKPKMTSRIKRHLDNLMDEKNEKN